MSRSHWLWTLLGVLLVTSGPACKPRLKSTAMVQAPTDPGLVFMEMDIFWTTYAGQDPLKYFDKYPGRFISMHLQGVDLNAPLPVPGGPRPPLTDSERLALQNRLVHMIGENRDHPERMMQLASEITAEAPPPGRA